MEAPRQTDRGNIRHKLENIIIIGLSTLLCGGEDFPDMEEFGKERANWLRAQDIPGAAERDTGQCNAIK